MQTQLPENNPLPSDHPRPPRRARRVFSLVAALLVIAVLIGGLATVLELSHQKSGIQTGSGQVSPTPALSPTSVLSGAPGHIIYSSPQESGSVGEMALSADGQRVVAEAGGQIQIWDATTGKHSVTVQLPNADQYEPSSIWSPTSELLAIPTDPEILIVNGQTGQIIAKYPESSTDSTATIASFTGGGSLNSHFPTDQRNGFMALTWSPDGKELASAFFHYNPDSSVVQIWNTQTGLSSTLATQTDDYIDQLSWSSDGMDILASTTAGHVIVWSVVAKQIVFQQSIGLSIGSMGWQSGTHNIAFVTIDQIQTQDATKRIVGLQIWNVTTNSLIKSISSLPARYGILSPDGKELAYVTPSEVASGSSSGVSIMNIASGQTVSPYKVSYPASQYVAIDGLAWSSDGKEIATGYNQRSNSNSDPGPSSYKVQVWVV